MDRQGFLHWFTRSTAVAAAVIGSALCASPAFAYLPSGGGAPPPPPKPTCGGFKGHITWGIQNNLIYDLLKFTVTGTRSNGSCASYTQVWMSYNDETGNHVEWVTEGGVRSHLPQFRAVPHFSGPVAWQHAAFDGNFAHNVRMWVCSTGPSNSAPRCSAHKLIRKPGSVNIAAPARPAKPKPKPKPTTTTTPTGTPTRAPSHSGTGTTSASPKSAYPVVRTIPAAGPATCSVGKDTLHASAQVKFLSSKEVQWQSVTLTGSAGVGASVDLFLPGGKELQHLRGVPVRNGVSSTQPSLILNKEEPVGSSLKITGIFHISSTTKYCSVPLSS